MPKHKLTKGLRGKESSEPLLKQLERDDANQYAKEKKWKKKKEDYANQFGVEEGKGTESSVMTAKVLRMAREQLQEEEEEAGYSGGGGVGLSSSGLNTGRMNEDSEEEEEQHGYSDEENEYFLAQDQYADLEISGADERIIEQFMNPNAAAKPRKTLADLIREKLQEKEERELSETATAFARRNMSPQMIEVYTSVGELMSRYRSGKIPKAFKIIPIMKNWEEVLYITRPEEWSPHAMYAATRIFASNLNPKLAQRFYNLVLLPAVREDISEHKSLNHYYYQSLVKAFYKPGAWFKGILIPLCESGDCTLREATIIGSVMTKISIPMMHSAAAMMKIASMSHYEGAASLFLRVLMNKKYTLPHRVIDAVVTHFLRFHNETRDLPLLWHQSLLTFVQRYRSNVTPEQKEALRILLQSKHLQHKMVTPEIRRELFSQVKQ